MSAFKAPLDPSTALGGFSGNNYSEVIFQNSFKLRKYIGCYNNYVFVLGCQASAFIITYPVNNAIDKEGNETGRAVAWEKAFVQIVKVWILTHVSVTF